MSALVLLSLDDGIGWNGGDSGSSDHQRAFYTISCDILKFHACPRPVNREWYKLEIITMGTETVPASSSQC